MRVKMIPIDQLILTDSARASLHNEDLIASIKEIGIQQPISVDQNYRILDGKCRYEAAKVLGIKELLCCVYELHELQIVTPTYREKDNMKIKMISVEHLKASISFQNIPKDLYHSIKEKGILTPLIVTEDYAIIDGRERYKVAKVLGIKEIPCYVFEADEWQKIQAEIISSLHRVKTDPKEYKEQFIRLCKGHPDMLVKDLINKLGKTRSWMKKTFDLKIIRENMTLKQLIEENQL